MFGQDTTRNARPRRTQRHSSRALAFMDLIHGQMAPLATCARRANEPPPAHRRCRTSRRLPPGRPLRGPLGARTRAWGASRGGVMMRRRRHAAATTAPPQRSPPCGAVQPTPCVPLCRVPVGSSEISATRPPQRLPLPGRSSRRRPAPPGPGRCAQPRPHRLPWLTPQTQPPQHAGSRACGSRPPCGDDTECWPAGQKAPTCRKTRPQGPYSWAVASGARPSTLWNPSPVGLVNRSDPRQPRGAARHPWGRHARLRAGIPCGAQPRSPRAPAARAWRTP